MRYSWRGKTIRSRKVADTIWNRYLDALYNGDDVRATQLLQQFHRHCCGSGILDMYASRMNELSQMR